MYIIKVNGFYLSNDTDMVGHREIGGELKVHKINNLVLTQDFREAMLIQSENGAKALAEASKGDIFKIEEVPYNG